MLSSNLLKASSNLLSLNPTYLTQLLASSQRSFSVAFNVKSKFEEAYLKKKASTAANPKKE
jgi:hypothetical protein